MFSEKSYDISFSHSARNSCCALYNGISVSAAISDMEQITVVHGCNFARNKPSAAVVARATCTGLNLSSIKIKIKPRARTIITPSGTYCDEKSSVTQNRAGESLRSRHGNESFFRSCFLFRTDSFRRELKPLHFPRSGG